MRWRAGVHGRVFGVFLTRRQIGLHRHVPRAPWTNGAAEFIRALRQLLAEQHRQTMDWVRVLRLAVFAVNNTPSVQLGGRTPFTVFTGRPTRPLCDLASAFDEEFPGLTTGSILAMADAMRASFQDTERDVIVHRQAAVERRQLLCAAQPHDVKAVDFVKDDYVLVATAEGLAGVQDKLAPLWEGPFQVTASPADQVAEVRRVGSSARQRVHVQRLVFFHGPNLEITEEMQRLAGHSAPNRNVVGSITGIVNRGRAAFRFTVRWVGQRHTTEEPVTRLYHDVPDVVTAYLERTDLPYYGQALVPNVWLAIRRSSTAQASTQARREAQGELEGRHRQHM